jgi:RNA polymerase subunit RPABC4/transcription elongation factor Spt4
MNWNNVSLVVLGLAAFFGAFFVALWASLVIWTFRDMRGRSRDAFAQFLAALMVLVLGPFGVILYFILRPRETLAEKYERSLEEEALLQDIEERQICPGCKQPIQPDYRLCPICHTHLRTACIHCGRLIHPRWDLCPYCAQSQKPVPGLDRAASVTLQDLEAEPEPQPQRGGTDATEADADKLYEPAFDFDEDRIPQFEPLDSESVQEPKELPEELMAELQREADASMARPSLDDKAADDAGDQETPAQKEVKKTRQLNLSPAQTDHAPAEEPADDPADTDSDQRNRRPLSLFRRR